MPKPPVLPSSYFTLIYRSSENLTLINMQLLTKSVSTKNFPKTNLILKKFLPTIFKHKCFNYKRRSFYTEAKQTEIGHLFEHIILEYLLSLSQTLKKSAVFKGKTNWDWTKNSWGSFDIYLNIGKSDKKIFELALAKSIFLINFILSSNAKNISTSPPARS